MIHRITTSLSLFLVFSIGSYTHSAAQERLKIAYSSADASNAVWFIALDGGMYRKYGLDVELIFIQSSTMSVSTLVSGDIQVANNSGGAVASAVVGGANLVMTCVLYQHTPVRVNCPGIDQVGGRSARQKRRHQPGRQRVRFGGAGVGQRAWTRTGKGCADPPGRRHRGAGGGVSRRANRRLSVTSRE